MHQRKTPSMHGSTNAQKSTHNLILDCAKRKVEAYGPALIVNKLEQPKLRTVQCNHFSDVLKMTHNFKQF